MVDEKVQSYLDALMAPSTQKDGIVGEAINRCLNQNEPFNSVFGDFLQQLCQNFEEEHQSLDKKEKELQKRMNELQNRILDRIIEFLIRSQPGALTAVARDVCRQKGALFQRLGITIDELNSRIIRE